MQPAPMDVAWIDRLDARRPQLQTRLAARAWARIFACEYRAIGRFDRLAKQLQDLVAPTELIEMTRSFADDERSHASAALALACRIDPNVEPARLGPSPKYDGLLEETIVDGCMGDTLSALEFEHMRVSCTDDAIATMLSKIAAEEARHAHHAWIVLAWLLHRFPTLLGPAAETFTQHRAATPLGLDRDLPAFGLLADSTRVVLWETGRRHVVGRLAVRVLTMPPAPVERDAILC